VSSSFRIIAGRTGGRARAVLLILLLAASPAAQAEVERPALNNAVATGRIFGFMEILRIAGIPVEKLVSEDVTLILPVDTQFYDLSPEHYQAIFSPANRDLALKYVQAHMIMGRVSLKQLAQGGYRTVGGVEIKAVLGVNGAASTINGCKVARSDITGTTGTVHLISGWLLRP
jgi:uncharacterized surface protein with fasciclin (FAS1) repeats